MQCAALLCICLRFFWTSENSRAEQILCRYFITSALVRGVSRLILIRIMQILIEFCTIPRLSDACKNTQILIIFIIRKTPRRVYYRVSTSTYL
ncbi:hypothetical protein BJ165DRAFT_645893 [Panaeolus papilionaceus]|nr:hypothetical protein BJ165DRAFT_645893 [Panaeolus papilionaceus]